MITCGLNTVKVGLGLVYNSKFIKVVGAIAKPLSKKIKN
ncbi:hypothetical protein M595_1576 [Lyngbya aestuarii BL J]|uniref:Uncharacterized protein n=1 Tax=Lyngbya aestuarii BL J TaxID=1348334 RepID=U7QKF0_9CYAN|nr:hypothetical protein M595_1576 [Lyngbya aestuarii BL J]